ncbi:hypothetical protein KSP40_PGU002255 [Platanthera guangdongensis]|uniref:Uncharacterized protein n=1 Tax=Platanthera guangdongensis TaxID=2320717 RepID=A0ABR2M5A7_9ASPA
MATILMDSTSVLRTSLATSTRAWPCCRSILWTPLNAIISSLDLSITGYPNETSRVGAQRPQLARWIG